MIRDVVIHPFNDQPIVVDMFDMPTARDAGLVCTNLRTLDGRRPTFILSGDSVFFFPYQHVRFVEIKQGSGSTGMAIEAPAEAAPEAPEADQGDLEIDEDFLRRIREA